jgi:hypothetical protein
MRVVREQRPVCAVVVGHHEYRDLAYAALERLERVVEKIGPLLLRPLLLAVTPLLYAIMDLMSRALGSSVKARLLSPDGL